MKKLVIHVNHIAMPEMRFTYNVDEHIYVLICSEYKFLGKWIEFEEKDHQSLCDFLYLVIESNNIDKGFTNEGYTVTGVKWL